MERRLKILFLCTGNSCRSQMAEGRARHLKAGAIEPYSAGIEARGVDPLAVKAMAEGGVDISGQRSKRVDELPPVRFDHVVTLCGHAREHCPLFGGDAKVVHVGFDDPLALARQAPTPQQAMDHYRRVRDLLKAFVQTLPEALEKPRDGG